MKITDVKTYPVWFSNRNLCIVKVETDEGIYGWGESGLSGRELAVKGAIDHFREFLIGQDARHIGAIWQELYRGQYFEGGRVLTAAISAIDIALWDIKAKSLNAPLYELLGGKLREKVPSFITSIKRHDKSLIDEVKNLVKQGWTVIRIMADDLGTPDKATEWDARQSLDKTAGICKELRQEIGSSIVLGLDFHHRLSVAEAAAFSQKIPDGTLDFLEEPIRCENPESYETLKSMCRIPLAIGEEFSSKWAFRPYIEKGLTQFARIDVCNVGGISEAMKVAAMTETHYIDVMPHDPLGPICTAASMHVSSVVPNFAWYEVPPYGRKADKAVEEIFTGAPDAETGFYKLSTRPGHGVDVNEDALQNLALKFWEAPRMKKPDGSFTNW